MASQNIDALFDDKDVAAFLKGMNKRLKEVNGGQKRFVGLLSAIVFSDIIDHFEKEEGSGGPWEKWSPAYAEHMREIGRSGNKILQFTGNLRQNVKPTNVRNTGNGLLWFNDAHAPDGSPYAAMHDDGSRGMPKRDFMWLSERGAEEVAQKTLAFMIEEGV